MSPDEFFERFGHLIDRGEDDDCWPWRGQIAQTGYGFIDIYGRGDGTRERFLAHRLASGAPKGKVTRHLCHNPPCVNPRHLAVGTQAENMRDMILAGRSRSQIAPHLVPAIRACIAAGVSTKLLAKMTGTSTSTINKIGRGDTFAVLPGEITPSRNIGDGHLNAKLTARAVAEIRRLHAAGTPQTQIARQFNVTPQAICLIVKRKNWKHVA